MNHAFAEVWRSPWVRVATFGLAIYLIYRFLDLISTVVLIFALAYLLAYLFNPMLEWLQKRRVRRSIGLLIVLSILVSFLVLMGFILVAVFNQLSDFVQRLPELFQSGTQLVQSTLRRIRGMSDVPAVQQYTQQLNQLWQDNLAAFSRNGLKFLEDLLSQSGSLLVTFTNLLVQVVFVLILSFYLMSDFHRVNQTFLRLLPEHWQPRARELSTQISTAVGGYVRGQITIAFLEGTMIAIGLAMSGIPNALALGFIAGLFGIVPYLGVVLSMAPALLLAFALGWTKVGLVVLVFFIANQLEGNFLSPWILGRTTNLHPATVLLSLLIGVELIGLWGTLLAVPVAALIKLLLQKYYFDSRFYRSTDALVLQSEHLKP